MGPGSRSSSSYSRTGIAARTPSCSSTDSGERAGLLHTAVGELQSSFWTVTPPPWVPRLPSSYILVNPLPHPAVGSHPCLIALRRYGPPLLWVRNDSLGKWIPTADFPKGAAPPPEPLPPPIAVVTRNEAEAEGADGGGPTESSPAGGGRSPPAAAKLSSPTAKGTPKGAADKAAKQLVRAEGLTRGGACDIWGDIIIYWWSSDTDKPSTFVRVHVQIWLLCPFPCPSFMPLPTPSTMPDPAPRPPHPVPSLHTHTLVHPLPNRRRTSRII